jgi:hypothetical protein
MYDASSAQDKRGSELLLEDCAVLSRVFSSRTPAVERLEQALGGELTRLLVVALARRRTARVTV